MLLKRTEKAVLELQPGVRTLAQRERGVLFLADGRKQLKDFAALYDGEGERIAAALVSAGYLEVVTPQAPVANDAPRPEPRPEAAAQAGPQAPAAPAMQAADTFSGKRSLATTRMFLFDLCERMFSRKEPALAEAFRTMLRDARDRESMLATAREMLAEIERIAGGERADSIGERLAMLLPED